MEECEVKFLGIDPVALERQIMSLGGTRKWERLFRRSVFDFPDYRLNSDNSWLRLRDEGDQVVLMFKQRLGVTTEAGKDRSMVEEGVVVEDFDATVAILKRLGMIEKFYEENRRTHFELDGVMLDIDHWPMIPPYLEIEGPDWPSVTAMMTKLHLDPAKKQICSTQQIYSMHGINEDDYQVITFDRQIKRVVPSRK